MKRKLRKLSLLLCFILVLEVPCGYVCKTSVKAAATTDEIVTRYLTRGFDAVQTPYAKANQVMNYAILDSTKIQNLKGNYWYNSLIPSKKLSYTYLAEANQHELEKSYGTQLGVRYNMETAGFSDKVTTNYSEKNFQNDLCGKLIASCMMSKFTTSMDLSQIKKCLSSSFLADVNAGNYKYVFQKYGTHLIKQASFGGRLTVDYSTNSSCRSAQTEIRTAAQESFQALVNNQASNYQTSIAKMLANCSVNFSCEGGNQNYLPTSFRHGDSFQQWYNSVTSQTLYQIDDCIPLWELFDDTNIYNNLKKAYYQYFNEHLNSLKASIPFVTDIQVEISDNPINSSRLPGGGIVTRTDSTQNYINSDLNRHAKGKYVYMAYKMGLDKNKEITGVYVDSRTKPTNVEANYGYIFVPGDLNEGAKGKYIYLNYGIRCSLSKKTFQAFCTRNTQQPISPEWEMITKGGGDPADLNEGAGGDFIYLFGYRDPLFGTIDAQIKSNSIVIARIR